MRLILEISTRIRWFANTLANSSGFNKRMPGRNATGGSFTIIERLHRSCRIHLANHTSEALEAIEDAAPSGNTIA
jgi:hypothetical protein